MKPILPILLIAAAGFAIGICLPPGGENPKDPTISMRTRSSREGGSSPAWLDPKVAAADRMAVFVGKAADLTPEEWPAFFKARLGSPEWSRLAAELWADRDPGGFWDFLRRDKDPMLLDQWGSGLVKTWTVSDPDAAMAAVMAITDKETADKIRREVVDTVLGYDLQKGLQFAAMAGDFNRFSGGPRSWMNENPEAAVRGLAALPKISDYRDYLGYAIEIWAKADPQAALAWMKNENPRRNEPPLPNDIWMAEGFKAAATEDPKAALATALSMANPRERDKALGGILSSGKVAPTDLPALLDACSLVTQSKVLRNAISSLPKNTPADLAAATEILLHAPASRNSLQATATIAEGWAALDWNGGWQWAETLPDVATRREALETLARRANADQRATLATRIAGLPDMELSNRFFENILRNMPENERNSWIEKLPPARAAWARKNLK